MGKENIPQENKRNYLLWALAIFALIAFLIVLGFYIFHFKTLFIIKDSATWGTFGDYVGGTLNPIISFLALIGLLYTIHQQAQEMEATRNELKQSAEQQSRQSEIFNLQQFESTFFSLLEQHNNILEKITNNNNKIIKNKKFNNLKLSIEDESIKEIYNNYLEYEELYSLNQSHIENSNRYIRNNIRQNPELRRYFIILFQILKFISISLSTDRQAITTSFSSNNEQSREILSSLYIDPKEKIYSNILRSLIPNEILKILALNCLTLDNSTDIQNLKTFFNFQGLLNRYNFLEHLQLIFSNDVCPIKNHHEFICLFLLKTIGIDDLQGSFSNNYTPEEITDLFINSQKNFISILNDKISKLTVNIKNYNMLSLNKQARETETILKKFSNMLSILKSIEN